MRNRAFAVAAVIGSSLMAAGTASVRAEELIAISPDDTVLVERYVREIPAPPPVIEEHMTLRPGSVIPEGVPLQRFENVASLDRLAYFVSVDHKIVVADSRTRVVVRILDQHG